MIENNKSISAPVNKIIPLSSVDGPGARTTIFMQRCNISCLYCHNPETQRLCINCGICVEHCPSGALSLVAGKVVWDEEKCSQCDTCIKVCPHFSTPKTYEMTAAETFEKIRPNLGFIRGITVSGGECSLYPEFLTELFILAKNENLTCLMDSSGMNYLARYPELIENIDGVMLDVKAWEQPTYQVLTRSSSNNTVKKNLAFLAEKNLLTEIRIVNVPDYVDAANTIAGIAGVIGDKIAEVPLKLISFRNNGVKGILANHRSPTTLEMAELKEHALSIGFKKVMVV